MGEDLVMYFNDMYIIHRESYKVSRRNFLQCLNSAIGCFALILSIKVEIFYYILMLVFALIYCGMHLRFSVKDYRKCKSTYNKLNNLNFTCDRGFERQFLRLVIFHSLVVFCLIMLFIYVFVR